MTPERFEAVKRMLVTVRRCRQTSEAPGSIASAPPTPRCATRSTR